LTRTSLGWLIGLLLAGCNGNEAGTQGGDVPTRSTLDGSSPLDGVDGASQDTAPGSIPADATQATDTTSTPPFDAGVTGTDAATGSFVGDADTGGPPPPITPPVPDTSSTLGISAPGGQYIVEGNLPYGPLAMQRLDVIYPAGAGPKGNTTLPGVVMFHGGGWIDNKPGALKASMSSFFGRFLAHGFLVCNVEYRLADGTANGAIAPAAVEDALLAAKWFWDHMDYYHVDKTRYVVTGASAGGHLALMVGMATPTAQLGPTSPNDYKIAAIVNGYGPSDVSDLLARGVSFAVQWLPANTPNRDAIARQVSPITYVRQDVPPLITVQGANDTTVPVAESQHLYDLLKAAGAVTDLHFVTGAGHGFSTPATAWPDAETTMFAFLTAHGI
jgi:acetyl esterase/lipase